MAARKLQQDIDKTFKKVAEGIAIFEGIFEKIQQTTNASQKEKLEDNLKREIKKLQRHRDQIKTWAAGNEIKDKKPLLEQRKLIETEMEKFKAVEKEMKTKAFSKEGLSAAAKLDPKEQEKLDGCTFVSDMVEELERQIETLEAEEESLQATVKKGKKDSSKADRLSEISRLTERHKWHQSRLELLLRALENNKVEVEQLNDIKDSIKYYVEENQSPEFLEDDAMYDDFNLDQDEAAWGIPNEVDKVSSHDAQSVQDENVEPAVETRASSAQTAKDKKNSLPEPSSAAARRPSNQLKSPLPALATLHAPLSNIQNTAAPNHSHMKPAPPPSRPPGETLKYASAAAAAAASEKSAIAPLPPGPTANTLAPLPPPPTKSAAASSPSVAAALPAASSSSKSAPSVPPGITTKAASTRSPAVSSALPEAVPPTPVAEKHEASAAPSRTKSSSAAASATAAAAPPEPIEPIRPAPLQTPPGEPHPTNGVPDAAAGDEESIYHLPAGLQDLVHSFEVTKSRVAPPSSQPVQRMLAASHATCPSPLDAEKPRSYKPANKYHTPPYYPQEPFSLADDPNLYARIDTDTLFYIFYYRQGTYQQYLAAKSLKNQSWRFHKQYQTWFQRHEEPKTITEEYEQGTYRFFDYESTWMNRRKADFKFAYKFLEDDL